MTTKERKQLSAIMLDLQIAVYRQWDKTKTVPESISLSPSAWRLYKKSCGAKGHRSFIKFEECANALINVFPWKEQTCSFVIRNSSIVSSAA